MPTCNCIVLKNSLLNCNNPVSLASLSLFFLFADSVANYHSAYLNTARIAIAKRKKIDKNIIELPPRGEQCTTVPQQLRQLPAHTHTFTQH